MPQSLQTCSDKQLLLLSSTLLPSLKETGAAFLSLQFKSRGHTRSAPASGHKRLMTQKNKRHPLLVLHISVLPDPVHWSEDCCSLSSDILVNGKSHTSSHSGVWDGLAFGTSCATPLQTPSSFTVLVLHTHMHRGLGSGIK